MKRDEIVVYGLRFNLKQGIIWQSNFYQLCLIVHESM